MITGIIDIFKNQAREHKAIKTFYYNRNYELGSGTDIYPLFWLEDPINGRNQDNTFTNSINFSILFAPKEGESISHLQSMSLSIGLNIIERIKKNKEIGVSIKPDWTYTTLREYYDDSAAGCRFSVNFVQRNMQNLCLINEQFDLDKQFEMSNSLPDFDMSPANNCDVFVNKFPAFDLKTRK
jgi:hypothetical protein